MENGQKMTSSGPMDIFEKLSKEKGPSTYDIVKEYWPEATDEFCEFIIWEKTGYPHFWDIPEDGATPVECFRKQVAEAKNKEPS